MPPRDERLLDLVRRREIDVIVAYPPTGCTDGSPTSDGFSRDRFPEASRLSELPFNGRSGDAACAERFPSKEAASELAGSQRHLPQGFKVLSRPPALPRLPKARTRGRGVKYWPAPDFVSAQPS